MKRHRLIYSILIGVAIALTLTISYLAMWLYIHWPSDVRVQ